MRTEKWWSGRSSGKSKPSATLHCFAFSRGLYFCQANKARSGIKRTPELPAPLRTQHCLDERQAILDAVSIRRGMHFRVVDAETYQALPWVRYITQNGEYQIRMN